MQTTWLERGAVRSRVALLLRSSETQPLFARFVRLDHPQWFQSPTPFPGAPPLQGFWDFFTCSGKLPRPQRRAAPCARAAAPGCARGDSAPLPERRCRPLQGHGSSSCCSSAQQTARRAAAPRPSDAKVPTQNSSRTPWRVDSRQMPPGIAPAGWPARSAPAGIPVWWPDLGCIRTAEHGNMACMAPATPCAGYRRATGRGPKSTPPL